VIRNTREGLGKAERVPGYHDLASSNNSENSLIQFSIDRAPVKIKLRTK
jgi:hypothetical protein